MIAIYKNHLLDLLKQSIADQDRLRRRIVKAAANTSSYVIAENQAKALLVLSGELFGACERESNIRELLMAWNYIDET